MELPNYHEDFSINHVNTLDNRCYYQPKDQNGAETRILLSGDDWKFKLFPDYLAVPEGFSQGEWADFSEISVPSCWNSLGFEGSLYHSGESPIPFDPPFVPTANPCGGYGKIFHITEEHLMKDLHLYFEGVDSCFYLWINGNFVGYSQVSHSSSEFDISSYVNLGENRLSVLVLKWCDGTYFEGQSKFRMSGIFRDVSLMPREKNRIVDYRIKTDLKGLKALVSVEYHSVGTEKDYEIELISPTGASLFREKSPGKSHFLIENPFLWSAEVPNLYQLIFHGTEVVTQVVGIKRIEVHGGVFYLNNMPIKIKGVNFQEFMPKTGYTYTKEEFLEDLRLMKAHNINAVRTSHYPQAPWVMDLYAEHGFYVMNEADLETYHCDKLLGGGHEENFRDEILPDYSLGLLAWEINCKEAILDRVQRMAIRDKNAPAVLMWSLGNRSGYGENLEESAAWLKAFDSSWVIHYEGSIYQREDHGNDLSNIDVYSRLFPDVQSVKNHIFRDGVSKPYLLCGYAQAAGNSCGDLGDYFQVFHSNPCIMGGFIWEWCDQAVFQGKTEDGRDKFSYFGDGSQLSQSGKVSGLVSPLRRPYSGLLEHKQLARGIHCEKFENGRIILYNSMDFIDIKDIYTVVCEYYQGQRLCHTELLEVGSIPPRTRKELPYTQQECGEDSYTFIKYLLKKDQSLLKKGHVAGFEQIIHKQRICRAPAISNVKTPNLSQNPREFVVEGENFRYVIDKSTGTPSSLLFSGQEFLQKPISMNTWRAPLDNDQILKEQWLEAGINELQTKVYDISAEMESGCVKVEASFALAPVFRQKMCVIVAAWTIFGDGSMKVEINTKRDPIYPHCPRFGLRLSLPKEMERVQYYGFGPNESYQDKHHSSYKALFLHSVPHMYEDYLRPQEHGSRWDCDMVVLASDDHKFEVFGEGFSFSTSHFSQEQLEGKALNYLLEEENSTILCLDSAMSGVGSTCLGAELEEKYHLKESDYYIKFLWRFSEE